MFLCNFNIYLSVVFVKFYSFANYYSTIVSAKCDCCIKARILIHALRVLQLMMEVPTMVNGKIFIEWRNLRDKGSNTTMTDLKRLIREKIFFSWLNLIFCFSSQLTSRGHSSQKTPQNLVIFIGLKNQDFARQPCCMAGTIDYLSYAKKRSFYAKHFHCFGHATWLPCKTSFKTVSFQGSHITPFSLRGGRKTRDLTWERDGPSNNITREQRQVTSLLNCHCRDCETNS